MMTPNYPLSEGCIRRNPHSVFVHPKSLTGFQPVTSYFGRGIFLGCGFYLFFQIGVRSNRYYISDPQMFWFNQDDIFVVILPFMVSRPMGKKISTAVILPFY